MLGEGSSVKCFMDSALQELLHYPLHIFFARLSNQDRGVDRDDGDCLRRLEAPVEKTCDVTVTVRLGIARHHTPSFLTGAFGVSHLQQVMTFMKGN